MKRRVPELTRSRYAVQALDWIFGRPIFRGVDFMKKAGIPKPTAYRALKMLHRGEILSVARTGRGRRSPVYLFPSLLNIAEGRKAFS